MRWWMLAAVAMGCGSKETPPDASATRAPAPAAKDFGADGEVLAMIVPLAAPSLPPELVGFERGFSDLLAWELKKLGVQPPGFEERAEVAIAGQLTLLGNTMRVDMRVARMPPAEPEVLGVASGQGSIKNFADEYGKIVSTLAKVLGLPAPDSDPTTSVEAITSLGRALIALDAGKERDAVLHLDEALTADPALARATELKEGLSAPR